MNRDYRCVALVLLGCLLLAGGVTIAVAAQTPASARQQAEPATPPRVADETLQRQIDAELWIPFLAASNAFDADGFLAAQSKDVVRIAPDANQIYGLARYETEIREGFKRARERGIKRKSDMRFLRRVAAGNLAYESGYFRSEATLANGEVRIRYSKFDMVLRKEGNRWKILVDQDTAENGTITEAAFQAAAPLGAARR